MADKNNNKVKYQLQYGLQNGYNENEDKEPLWFNTYEKAVYHFLVANRAYLENINNGLLDPDYTAGALEMLVCRIVPVDED